MTALWYILLLDKAYYETEYRQTPSRNRKRHRFNQSDNERYIQQRRIPRCCSVLPVERSTWQGVYTSRDPQAMTTLTGFDAESFEYICNLFAPYCNDFSPFIDPEGYIVNCEEDKERTTTN